ncbi:ClpP/crotonase-like domain-containing protein [Pavlovales sp. CCMP2436]|nr:ClpP/crotonase-like domain-containing protein [Pavlovales sp. CCMP2436]|mmetsp:Transcript_36251/g.90491  ORF Transcript_36251/g.90491 Transcript_36251/m.90491 type:complete len:278 (-) Transcript_36251:321-1154(-)
MGSGWPTLTTMRVDFPSEGVVHVELARGHKRNAMTSAFFEELASLFDAISLKGRARCVLLSAEGPAFSAGIDLSELSQHDGLPAEPARKALVLRQKIWRLQRAVSALEACPQPVVALVHGAAIGGAVDLLCAADIRWCSADAWFRVAEVELGLAADLGTLQRLPGLVGSRSLACELAFSARPMGAAEAAASGFVSRVLATREELFDSGLALAKQIAAMPPVAVAGTKAALLYSRDHPAVADGLDQTALYNSIALQTRDLDEAAAAKRERRVPCYARL